MSYTLHKNFFKDYFWQHDGSHPYIAVQPSNPLNPYDNKYWWYDPWNSQDAWRWYIGELWNTSKFYALTHHEYPKIGAYTNKMGLGILAGDPTLISQGRPIQMVETSYEVPPNTMGGAVRPGFNGQAGDDTGVNHTGTRYRWACQYHESAEAEPPNDNPPPFGVSFYADCGVGATNYSDGIHITLVPPNLNGLWAYDKLGAWANYMGPGIAVGVDVLDNFGMAVMDFFTTYYDGTPISIAPDTEYFLRVDYWPEPKTLKRYNIEYPVEARLDRRVRIWMGTDKKRMKYVGESSLIERDYSSKRDYMMAYVYDYYSEDGGETANPYSIWYYMWDEVVCESEAIPYLEMTVKEAASEWGMTQIASSKDTHENNHSYGADTTPMPTFMQKEDVVVWSRVENLPVIEEGQQYDTFHDLTAWNTVNTVGTNQAEDSRWTKLADEFFEDYTNKGRDPRWTNISGNWATTGGALTCNTGAVLRTLRLVPEGWPGGDFVFETEIKLTLGGGSPQRWTTYLGFTAGYGGQAGCVYISWNNTTPGWKIANFNGAAFETASANVLSPAGTTRKVRFTRTGAYLKLYIDDTLVATVKASNHQAASGYCYQQIQNLTLEESYFRITPVFNDSYHYMTNTGGSTANTGNVNQNVNTSQKTGAIDVRFWENMMEGGADGEIRVKFHVDGGGAANYIGLRLYWNSGAGNYELYALHGGASTAITIPTGMRDTLPILHGYSEWRFRIEFTVDTVPDVREIGIRDLYNGNLLGTAFIGAGLNYSSNTPLLVVETQTTDGCEPCYLGLIQVFDTYLEDIDLLETEISHHTVRYIQPADGSGVIKVYAFSKWYDLGYKATFDTGTMAYDTETMSTFTNLLRHYLTENGDPYLRWCHYWNFNTSITVNWLRHRQRGKNAFDIFQHFTMFGGQFYSSPEMQMLFDEYYRDFHNGDPLGLGNGYPEGFYHGAHTLRVFNKTQQNYLKEWVRVDDGTVGKRAAATTAIGTSFEKPFDGDDQVYDSGAAAHQQPDMVDWPQQRRTGNLTDDTFGEGESLMMTTVGSWRSALNADPSDPATALQQVADNYMKKYSHEDEVFKIGVLACKQWFRPMDLIECRSKTYDPTLVDVSGSIREDHMYVVQKALHICHENAVVYTVGRVQEYLEEQEWVVKVGGYGETTSKDEDYVDLKNKAKDALTNASL